MAEKKNCRQYSVEYLKYGFIASTNNKQLPMCLMCKKVLSNEALRPSRLLDHLNQMHPDKKDKKEEFFRNLRDEFQKRKSVHSYFVFQQNKLDDGLLCSYKISRLIAKSGKPHTIKEKLILPAIEETLKTVVHHPNPRSAIVDQSDRKCGQVVTSA